MTLKRGSKGEEVKSLQIKLGLTPDKGTAIVPENSLIKRIGNFDG
jgi:hypothetical protein